MNTSDLEELYAINSRAGQADTPEAPALTERQFCGWWTYGMSGEPLETWAARSDDSRIVAGYNIFFFETDNTHVALLELVVEPGERRQGHGTRLLEHAIQRVRAAGRRLVTAEVADSSPGSAFAAAKGFERGLQEPLRVLDLQRADSRAYAELLEQARKAAEGYTLQRWEGSVPDAHVDAFARLQQQLSDAPVDDLEWGEELWDAPRIRAAERGEELRGEHPYIIVARHENSDELVGFTKVVVVEGQREWAHQEETVVLPAHRGHRLGLLLKLSMLEWLAEREPTRSRIVTGNAASNAHMLRINELLGFELLRSRTHWQVHV